MVTLHSLTVCALPPLQELSPALVSIAWGAREYLAPGQTADDGYRQFINAVNIGTEPRQGPCGRDHLYLRDGDWNKAVSGPPDLPPRWRPFVLTAPVRGRVIALSNDGHAIVNVGARHGLLPGMRLLKITKEPSIFDRVAIVAVAPETAELKAPEFSWDTRLQVGDQVASRFPGE